MVKRDKKDYEVDLQLIQEPFVGSAGMKRYCLYKFVFNKRFFYGSFLNFIIDLPIVQNYATFGAGSNHLSINPVRLQADLYMDGYRGAEGREKGFATPNKNVEVPITDIDPNLDPRGC